MHVVIAPDKFKGSLTAAEAAACLAAPFRAAGIAVTTIPMADGGEGTVDAALAAGHAPVAVQVTGPLGRPVQAQYALDATRGAAVIEMALASGLDLTSASDSDARRSTSRGTGELIAHALEAGARRIILGVGGSASTDGGAGMMAALGASLRDGAGRELGDGGIALVGLASVDLSGLHSGVADTEFILAADVNNPLLGPAGAAAVYGPQKGAGDHTVAELDRALETWARVLAGAGHVSVGAAEAPGAGAAGGVGFAAIALLGARREAGVDVILELAGFSEKVQGASLVITGEGSLDAQSLHGKTPVGVASAAAQAGAPTIAVAGRTTLGRDEVRAAGIVDRYQLLDVEPNPERAMARAGALLEQVAEQIIADHFVDGRFAGEHLAEEHLAEEQQETP